MQNQDNVQSAYTDKCPLRYALDKIGGKWKIPRNARARGVFPD
jgi:DNA-binding HxlR family transcriptional regulator